MWAEGSISFWWSHFFCETAISQEWMYHRSLWCGISPALLAAAAADSCAKLLADVPASGSCTVTSWNEKSSCFHVARFLQSWGLQWGLKLISHSLWVKIHLQWEWPPLTKSLNKCPLYAFPTVGIKFHRYDVSRPQTSLSPTHRTEIICKENWNDSHMHGMFKCFSQACRLQGGGSSDLQCNWKQVSYIQHIKKYTGNLGALQRFFQLLKIWRQLPSPQSHLSFFP